MFFFLADQKNCHGNKLGVGRFNSRPLKVHTEVPILSLALALPLPLALALALALAAVAVPVPVPVRAPASVTVTVAVTRMIPEGPEEEGQTGSLFKLWRWGGPSSKLFRIWRQGEA